MNCGEERCTLGPVKATGADTSDADAVRCDVPAGFLVIVSPPEFIGYFQEMLGLGSSLGSQPHDIELVDDSDHSAWGDGEDRVTEFVWDPGSYPPMFESSARYRR